MLSMKKMMFASLGALPGTFSQILNLFFLRTDVMF